LRINVPGDPFYYYGPAKKAIENGQENPTLGEFRWAIVHAPVIRVLAKFDPRVDEVPSEFRRHVSAHAVSRTQYTPANAVVALALATSLLREAQCQLDGVTPEPHQRAA
jgi:hypothetical protein